MSSPTRFPTINTFFQSAIPPSKSGRKLSDISSTPIGDGFTSSELTRDLVLTQGTWTPPHDYEEVAIGQLAPGPRWVTFTGKVVNILEHNVESRSPQAAKGCLRLLIKDETADIVVKLWYGTVPYSILLGSVVTIWTTHIHPTASPSAVSDTLTAHPSSLLTSIFPERDNGCSIRTRFDEDEPTFCKAPTGYVNGRALAGLMSLDTLSGGGSDIPDAKVLVCIVAIGQPMTSKPKDKPSFTTLPLGIRDTSTTTPYTLILPKSLIASASIFMLNVTILLITSPRLHPLRPNTLTLTSRSQIEINPGIPQSINLHKFIIRETCPINQIFPDSLFDFDALETSPLRIQFTFSTLTDFIKANPGRIYTGYISVIVSRLALTTLIAKKQLFSLECCHMPIYANTLTSTCGQCDQPVDLLLNPSVLAEIADETGGITTSIDSSECLSNNHRTRSAHCQPTVKHNRLLIHPQAFIDLFGRTPEALAAMCNPDLPPKTVEYNLAMLKCLEERLLWMRLTFMIGWTGDWGGGRLAVLRVMS